METRCMKIKLRSGSEPRVAAWAAELNRKREEVIQTLKAEGVVIESVFLDHQADGDYLIYFMRSGNFENAHRVASRSTSTIDEYHRAFKNDCWESRSMLRSLVDFETEASLHNS
ncbi:MAG: DUF6176 family protein [Microcystis panniformis]